MSSEAVMARLRSIADPQVAKNQLWFFKIAPGEYGHGDRFLGIKVGPIRQVVREFGALPITETLELLHSEFHKARTVALLIWVKQFQNADAKIRQSIYDHYLKHTHRINNWDLVDCSAPSIVGAHLLDRSRKPLDRLARSPSLWERRISIVATGYFIRERDFDDTLRISTRLLHDKEDLIHKAVGWMLREVGKRDPTALEAFLADYYGDMPRTMLRYAIERFSEPRRQQYLKGTA